MLKEEGRADPLPPAPDVQPVSDARIAEGAMHCGQIRTRLLYHEKQVDLSIALGGAALFIMIAIIIFIYGVYHRDGFEPATATAGALGIVFPGGALSMMYHQFQTARGEMRRGTDVETFYRYALGPPPKDCLDEARGFALGWLHVR